ncbi:ABC transporter substrate-binding protein [Actinopolymorpha pittospori]
MRAAAGGALALGGLGASACSQTGRKTVDGKPVLSMWAFSRDGRVPWHEEAWRLYRRAKRPDFELEILTLPFQQMHDKILVAAQAGSGGPDIADIEISAFGRFIKGEPIFVDLTPALRERKLLDQFYRASATDPWTFEDRVYGLGNELNTCLMVYRADLYDAAGVTTPVETWDQFAEEGRRYHRDTGKYLTDVEYLDWQEWWQLTLQQGGGFFDRSGRPALDRPEGIRTLTYRRRAVEEGWAIRRSSDTGSPQQFAGLGNGTIATMFGPAWYFSGNSQNYIPDTAGKWSLQPFPRWDPDGSRTATHGGTGVCVTRSCPLPDEAVDFVIWEHSTMESLLFDYRRRQTFPTFRPAYEDPALNEPVKFFSDQRVGQIVSDLSPDINSWSNSPFWPEVTQATLREGITPALSKDVEVAEAMRRAQEEAEKIIRLSTT